MYVLRSDLEKTNKKQRRKNKDGQKDYTRMVQVRVTKEVNLRTTTS